MCAFVPEKMCTTSLSFIARDTCPVTSLLAIIIYEWEVFDFTVGDHTT